MIWEALGFVVLGLAVAYAANKQLPDRFHNRSLVLATGPVSALLGGLVSRAVLGSGHAPATLFVSVAVSVAILSLLLDETGRSPGLRTEVISPPQA